MGILVLCALLTFGHNNAQASNSLMITAKVGSAPPSNPAVISSPQINQQLKNTQIPIEGTCQPKTYVTILSNKTIRGGTICDENSRFAVNVSLDIGNNSITAQTHDGIDQSGPESSSVNVHVAGSVNNKLKINVDKSYQRIAQDDDLSWKVNFQSQSSFRAVMVEWGDGKSDLFPTQENEVIIKHKYDSAGARPIKVTASDGLGGSSELNLVASISSLDTLGGSILSKAGGYLSKASLYITVMLMVASFVVGSYYKGGKYYVWSEEKTAKNT